jgi:adenylosuccinate lyase
MPYKRNPMRAERMCGLSRFISTLAVSAAQTAATQWLERTLDDSANRRLSLPQAFLGADAVLRLALNLSQGLVVNTEVIRRNVEQVLPYMATENILMAGVAAGGDRQLLHERIRVHSMAATQQLKSGTPNNDLLDRLRADPAFHEVDFNEVLQESHFIGRAPEQVERFIEEEIRPIQVRYARVTSQEAELRV